MSSDTRRYLTEILSVFGATYNEEAFSELRQLEQKENKIHKLSSSDVWSSASQGRVMARLGYREVGTVPGSSHKASTTGRRPQPPCGL